MFYPVVVVWTFLKFLACQRTKQKPLCQAAATPQTALLPDTTGSTIISNPILLIRNNVILIRNLPEISGLSEITALRKITGLAEITALRKTTGLSEITALRKTTGLSEITALRSPTCLRNRTVHIKTIVLRGPRKNPAQLMVTVPLLEANVALRKR